jgi:hypothetical protein
VQSVVPLLQWSPHAPAEHSSPLEQLVPHAPQCCSEAERSTHAPSHEDIPAGHVISIDASRPLSGIAPSIMEAPPSPCGEVDTLQPNHVSVTAAIATERSRTVHPRPRSVAIVRPRQFATTTGPSPNEKERTNKHDLFDQEISTLTKVSSRYVEFI